MATFIKITMESEGLSQILNEGIVNSEAVLLDALKMLAIPATQNLKKYLCIDFANTRILGSSGHGSYNDIDQIGKHLRHLYFVVLIWKNLALTVDQI